MKHLIESWKTNLGTLPLSSKRHREKNGAELCNSRRLVQEVQKLK